MAYNHEQAKAYLYTLARPDKKINFYFTPLVKLSEPRGECHKPFSIYCSKDETCYYTLWLNGKEIHFDDDWKKGCGLSLKPGKYTIKIYVYIKHAVGTAFAYDHNLSMKSNNYEHHTMSDPYWQERRFEKTWDITMTENNQKLLCFFGHMYGDFRCQYNQDYYHKKYDTYEELMYYLDNVVEKFDFYEATYEWLEEVCSYWNSGIDFDYNSVDMSLVNQMMPKPKTTTTITKTSTSSTSKTTTTTYKSSTSTKTTTTSNVKTSSTNSKTSSSSSKDDGFYVGETKNGKKHGLGSYTSNDFNTIYMGTYKDDKRHGTGIYQELYGNSYYGNFVNDIPCGFSIRVNDNNEILMSFLMYYLPDKISVLIKPNKTAYIQSYDEGILKSTLKEIPNFTEYSVTLKTNQFEFLRFTDGTYIGQVKDGQPDGFGRIDFHDGDLYIGQWNDGYPTGLSFYVTKNNSYYIGNFKNFDYSGYGVRVDGIDGSIKIGLWEQNDLIKKL